MPRNSVAHSIFALFAFASALVCPHFSTVASAGDLEARIAPAPGETKLLTDIGIASGIVPVITKPVPKSKTVSYFIQLHGRTPVGKGIVYMNGDVKREVKAQEKITEFSIEVRLTSKNQNIELAVIDPLGKPTSYRLLITMIEPQPIEFWRTQTVINAGYGSVSFQNPVQQLSSQGLSFGARIDRSLTPQLWHWKIGGSLLYSLTSIKFLSGEIRGGYYFNLGSLWGFSILESVRYISLQNAEQGQLLSRLTFALYPSISRAVGRDREIQAYFRFAPVDSGLFSLSASKYEAGAGIIWKPRSGNQRGYAIAADWIGSKTLNLTDEISAGAVSLTLGYAF